LLATLTEAIASTVLSLGRGDIIGDTHATPDEFAWLDIGYTALKLIGFMAAPWLMNRIDPRSLIIGSTLAMGTACAIAAITARLDLLVALRIIQGFSGGTLLVGGQHHFSRLSATPPTAPSSPVRNGGGRCSRDDRPCPSGVVAR
jgi:DHA2 family multidrug resistance protein